MSPAPLTRLEPALILPPQQPARRAAQGFTLVEVIIAVAIVGILAAIALPSYRQYVVRGNRTVAKTALLDISQREENYFVDHKGYTATLGRLGYDPLGAATELFVNTQGAISKSNTGAIYSLMVLVNTPTNIASALTNCGGTGAASGSAYLVRAVPIDPPQKDADCETICLSNTGERGSSVNSAATNCWAR